MKRFKKACSVLLAVLMVAIMIPSLSALVYVEAADPGVVVNGDFSTYESYTGAQGQTAWKADGWDVRDWGVTMGASGQSGKGVQLSKDSSHKGATSLTQVIPVNTNAQYNFSFYTKAGSWTDGCDTVYGVCFTYSIDLGDSSASFTTTVADQATPAYSKDDWTKTTVSVSTGSNKYLRIRFISTGVGGNDSYLDTVALTVINAGDTGTHAKPTLTGWGTEKNRPASSSDNVIVQPGFESTTNAQWNTSDFLKQGVSIVTSGGSDGDAHSGSKFLKYYHGSVGYTDWPMFEFTCTSAGEYVFSAWVRTPHLSANNVGAASIGIIDRDTNKFLTYGNAGGSYDGHFSNPTTQLRSTATDDDWHLRSITFYVGAANSNVLIGMYGLKSTMYVDDISVHLLSKGTKYVGNQTGALSASTSVTNKYCESDNNLIVDCNMNTALAKDFWSKSSGWNNGFLEFNNDGTSTAHGKTLHFKGTSPASNKTYRYVKFVDVEPNTSYTVSFDYRVVKTGNPLMFIDNNIVKNATFHTPNLGSASNSWKEYAFTFNSGNYNRIGIVFKDGSGEAYFDDFRFFKNDNGITTEPEEETPIVEGNADLKPYETGTSRMEVTETGKLGLAFRFNLECTGVEINAQHIGDYTNGKVMPFEGNDDTYKLVEAGAVMTNKESIGENEAIFVRGAKGEVVNGKDTVIDIKATKLFGEYHKEYHSDKDGDIYTEEGIVYAVRIVNIPESHMTTMIYARPYYVYETKDGEQFTIYGEIESDAYEAVPDINDGWLEWD